MNKRIPLWLVCLIVGTFLVAGAYYLRCVSEASRELREFDRRHGR